MGLKRYARGTPQRFGSASAAHELVWLHWLRATLRVHLSLAPASAAVGWSARIRTRSPLIAAPCRPGHAEVPCDLLDCLAFDEVLAPNPRNRLYDQHPLTTRFESKREACDGHTSGEHFWTPIPRLRGSKIAHRITISASNSLC